MLQGLFNIIQSFFKGLHLKDLSLYPGPFYLFISGPVAEPTKSSRLGDARSIRTGLSADVWIGPQAQGWYLKP